MDVAEMGLVVLPRGEGRDLGVRMREQEPNQLLGGVTGGSEDGDADHGDSERSGASGELVNISAGRKRREGRRRRRTSAEVVTLRYSEGSGPCTFGQILRQTSE